MTTTSPGPQTATVARSLIGPALVVAVIVIAALAFFWFQPDERDEARLALLEADATLVLPALDGDLPELVGSESNVASRSWSGEWSITERTDRYALPGTEVDRYAEDLFDHIAASPWDITSARCDGTQVVITGRQVIDGDWATLEFTAWSAGTTGQLSVRSAISAVGGNAMVVDTDATEANISCDSLG